MRRAALLLFSAACASAGTVPVSPEDLQLHLDAVVVDAHCDIADAMASESYDLLARNPTHHVDLPRLQAGGVDAEIFSVSVHPDSVDLTRFSDRVGAVGGTIRRRALEDGQVELEVTIPCGW